MEYLILASFASATVGALIGNARGHLGMGALLGFLLGPLGWLIAAVTDSRLRCPACREVVQVGAKICPHCRASLAWRKGNPLSAERVKRSESPLVEAENWDLESQHIALDARQVEQAISSGKRKR